VKVIVEGTWRAGRYFEKWDGTDTRGNIVTSGVYFSRLDAGSLMQTHKMILTVNDMDPTFPRGSVRFWR
jgi:hypothetical protein